ncbi:MAG: UDP-glucose 4-epimerase GalE [Flavobacteriales bacterium]|nr:UDP-glucose 4-epimerase GalE [Flavobacteriales bacterium]
MKSVLVTGGAGFIGSHTVVELSQAGFRPVILDDFSNADDRVLDGLNKILGTDIPVYRVNCLSQGDLEEVIEKEKISNVIHFAAFKAVGESVQEPLKYYHNNVGSLISLLKAMETKGVKRIVFSSSCTVYGQPDILPVTEESPILPATSPYGYTKQVCEQLLKDYVAAQNGFQAVILRYFNPIGAHPSGFIGELPYGTPNNLVPFIAQTAAGLYPELTVHGGDYNTIDGSCLRDYIHVCDLANAHVRSLQWQMDNSDSFEIFNLGQGFGNSVLEVIHAFEEATGQKVNYRIGPRRSGDVEKIWADIQKADRILGWKSSYTLGEALRHSWNWQKYISGN